MVNVGAASSEPMRLLSGLVQDPQSSLVFFVGAGVTSWSTPLMSTQSLLRELVVEAARKAGLERRLIDAAGELDGLGFEMVLNDLLQICPPRVSRLFTELAQRDATSVPNTSHAFLAEWLGGGGTVITTNYDRLIERARRKGEAIEVRYRTAAYGVGPDNHSFDDWAADLGRGGTLFKLHGSLDEPSTCLGAVAHVGTTLDGPRADLVHDVFRTRPICIVGWRGADPDLPPVVASALRNRVSEEPVIWVVRDPGSPQRMSAFVRAHAVQAPIVSDSETLFETLRRARAEADPAPGPSDGAVGSLDHAKASVLPEAGESGPCSPSGLGRFVGLAFRRAGHRREALASFDAASHAALGEWSAARQETALTHWNAGDQLARRRAHAIVRQVRRFERRQLLGHAPDRGALYGDLSMAVHRLGEDPRQLLRIRGLAKLYGAAIKREAQANPDEATVALHKALFAAEWGRLRAMLVGGRRWPIGRVNRWVLEPMLQARALVEQTTARDVTTRFQVAIAVADICSRFGRCDVVLEDLPELDRLSEFLSDPALADNWKRRRARIVERCCG